MFRLCEFHSRINMKMPIPRDNFEFFEPKNIPKPFKGGGNTVAHMLCEAHS